MNRFASAKGIAASVQPGQSVYVAGGPTPPCAFIEALQNDAARSRGLRITTGIAPMLPNPFDLQRLHPTAVLEVPFAIDNPTGLPPPASMESAHYHYQPMSASGFLRYLHGREFDVGVLQVAPPDEQGRCSLGPGVEFLPVAMRRCHHLLGIVNPCLPIPKHGAWVPAAQLHTMHEVAIPLAPIDMAADAALDSTMNAIAQAIAQHVEDGSTLHLGAHPFHTALAKYLHNHRRLQIHSGLTSDGLMLLASSGALDETRTHRAAATIGSTQLHAWLADANGIHIAGYGETFAPTALAGLQNFVAITPALQIDLFGQCDLGHLSSDAVIGAYEAPDLARAARNSENGLSIIALRASSVGATQHSHIVAELVGKPAITIPRTDVDIVVTEHGVADLRDRSVFERARALIQIAAPQFQEALAQAWSERARRL